MRIVLEDGSGAVTLVDVEVDNGGAADVGLASSPENRNGDVVEHAKSGTFSAEGMMSASGERATVVVARKSIACGAERSAYTGKGPLDQIFRPGKTDAAHNGRGEGAVEKALDIAAIMYQRDNVRISERRRLEVKRRLGQKKFPNEGVLADGELVSRREGNFVLVGVVEGASHGSKSVLIAISESVVAIIRATRFRRKKIV